jgi:flagellar FliL protein
VADSAAKKDDEIPTPTTEKKVTSDKPQKPVLLLIVIVINMLVMVSVAMILWTSYKAERAKPKLQDIVNGEKDDQVKKAADAEAGVAGEDSVGKLVPLETFLVNLAGTRGSKLVKINMELEVDGSKVEEELDKRKPQMRDIIIILLSSKTYDQVTTKEGKEILRTEVRDTINSFLGRGKIKKVYFTDFIVN